MKNNIRIFTKSMQLCVISRQQFYSLHLLSLYKEAKKEKKNIITSYIILLINNIGVSLSVLV